MDREGGVFFACWFALTFTLPLGSLRYMMCINVQTMSIGR